MALIFNNPQGTITAPLPVYAGDYLGSLATFVGATGTTGTIQIGTAAAFPASLVGGVLSPTTPQIIPSLVGVTPIIVTIGSDTVTIYVNIIARTTSTCSSNAVSYSETVAYNSLNANADIYDGQTITPVNLTFKEFATNALALSGGLTVGSFYWDSTTNSLKKVV